MGMSPSQVVLVVVITLLASTSALSSTVENRQTEALFSNHYTTPVRHEVYSGRSLRLAKTFDENDGVTTEKGSTDTEERGNPLSNVVSKISDKVPISVKLTWWETIGKSTIKVRKKLGLEKVYGSELAASDNFKHYLTYYNRIEKHGMWSDARRYVSTFSVWQNMEQKLRRRITTVEELNEIRGTNAFRVYKRYANIFDDNIVNIMGSGYHNPINFGNDPNAARMEKMMRAEIWGESKRDVLRVKQWLGLRWAKPEELANNKYYQQYVKAFNGQVRRPTEAEDINALRGFIIASPAP